MHALRGPRVQERDADVLQHCERGEMRASVRDQVQQGVRDRGGHAVLHRRQHAVQHSN